MVAVHLLLRLLSRQQDVGGILHHHIVPAVRYQRVHVRDVDPLAAGEHTGWVEDGLVLPLEDEGDAGGQAAEHLVLGIHLVPQPAVCQCSLGAVKVGRSQRVTGTLALEADIRPSQGLGRAAQ